MVGNFQPLTFWNTAIDLLQMCKFLMNLMFFFAGWLVGGKGMRKRAREGGGVRGKHVCSHDGFSTLVME